MTKFRRSTIYAFAVTELSYKEALPKENVFCEFLDDCVGSPPITMVEAAMSRANDIEDLFTLCIKNLNLFRFGKFSLGLVGLVGNTRGDPVMLNF